MTGVYALTDRVSSTHLQTVYMLVTVFTVTVGKHNFNVIIIIIP